ncbi:toxin PIN [Enterococcus villorum]|uniref:toxin PIN n=1 Tax=Enterococcus villorum TaxID=112904 RepID=UPI003F8CBD19
MNDRHRRVEKLRKQELNAAKKKLEKEYGVSVIDAVRLTRKFTKVFGRMAEDIGNAFASFGKKLQQNMEEKE